MQQLVSVIIPTYKGADKINSAVDSVLNQTYKNIEVIVVDDNGENEPEQLLTAEKMKKYETFENVKYLVHKKNINGSAARNTGIRASKGFYLGFLDDDDVFLPDKTQKQVDCFEKLPDDYAMIYGSFLEHMTENTDRIVKADNADNFLYRFLCNEIIACSSTIMIKRSVLD
ncbi:MAG: glycosyltransferase family 2 protein, partial [Ruminococcus bromii]